MGKFMKKCGKMLAYQKFALFYKNCLGPEMIILNKRGKTVKNKEPKYILDARDLKKKPKKI
ncbi:hypothetical protein NQ314_011715 [Rhamnusium bicolor]|uniref:Uncharacterized protein n=1 Tax=Rhamnusium bicolor TaxID=1586634 RepID=A0AAV8XGT5_9CUCU|nr:hypothetical protein NQ314_011715 [Rhamnusium bicolor]